MYYVSHVNKLWHHRVHGFSPAQSRFAEELRVVIGGGGVEGGASTGIAGSGDAVGGGDAVRIAGSGDGVWGSGDVNIVAGSADDPVGSAVGGGTAGITGSADGVVRCVSAVLSAKSDIVLR